MSNKKAAILHALASGCALFFFCASGAALSAQTPPASLADALASPIVTVMDKTDAAGSDKHNYVSYARYYWPDPSAPGGLPFVLRPGEENEAQIARGDYPRIRAFFDTVDTLAAAWRANRDEAAARRAGEWLRAWLVLPDTRMNPHLEYAQIRLGTDKNHGTPGGILDARDFGRIIDNLRALDNSPALTAEDKEAIRSWFEVYFDWLLVSRLGSSARHAMDHQVTWFIAQTLPIAIYLERDNYALSRGDEIKKHMARQIIYNGSQPEELRSPNSLANSVFNLEAYARLARAAAPLGVDLWNYVTRSRGSLGKAIDFLKPYNDDPSKWPFPQQTPMQPGFLNALIKERDDAMKGMLPKIETAFPSPKTPRNQPPTVQYQTPVAPIQPAEIDSMLRSVTIVIDKDGAIFFNGARTTEEQIARLFSQVKAANRDIPIFVSLDENTPIRTILLVMDASRKAGFNKVSMQTR